MGKEAVAVTAARGDRTTEKFSTAADFEEWIAENHATSPGIWLQIAKKSAQEVTVDYAQALDVCLCWGWIDGQRRGLDENFFLQGYTRRTARSPWSVRNRDKVAALTEAGKMQPPGIAEVERAKADGRWDAAYHGQKNAEIPQDFLDELDKNLAAREFFGTLNSQNRYAVYFRLVGAKKPETRARRIAQFVEMFARGQKFH